MFDMCICVYTLQTMINLATMSSIQMVGLYRDPEGETIFEKSSKSIPASSTSNHQTQTIDSLRGRIKELEDTVAKLKVRISEHTHTHTHTHVHTNIYSVAKLHV